MSESADQIRGGGEPIFTGGGANFMERVEGIEPSTKAWEAFVLPLNYTRVLHVPMLTKRLVL